MSIKSEFSAQLEAYFSGEMKGADRLVFEGRVESDPVLKAEFENQQDVINSLREHRVAELKTRLNNISVEPTLIGSLLQSSVLKPIVYGVGSLAVVGGSYLFYNTDAAIEYHLERLEGKKEYLTASNLKINKQILDYRWEAPKYERLIALVEKEDHAEIGSKPSAVAVQSTKEVAFEVPEIGNDLTGDEFKAPGLSIDEAKKIEQVPTLAKMDKVHINTVFSRKYNFHYKMEDNRLFLYGKFNDSPYEIIELNTPSKKTLFFFYNGSFYDLSKEANTVTPLSRIEDERLIDQLGQLKAKNSQ